MSKGEEAKMVLVRRKDLIGDQEKHLLGCEEGRE
jgi:hypothetical protein